MTTNLLGRHNVLVRLLATELRALGYTTTTAESAITLGNDNKVDLIATNWAKHSKPLAIDLTVAHPLCASHVAVAAVAPDALLRQLERGKREKHAPAPMTSSTKQGAQPAVKTPAALSRASVTGSGFLGS